MNSDKKEIWGPWATAGLGFLIFILWAMAQAFPIMVMWVLRLRQEGGKDAMGLLKSLTENGDALALATIFGSLVGFGFIWLVLWLRQGAKLPEYLGFHALETKTLLWVLGAGALFCLASDLLTYFLGMDIVPKFMIQVCSTSTSPVLLILGINLFGPFFEEIFFRGFLFEGWRRSRLGNTGAALLVTAAWAGLHTQYDLYEVATLFVGGLGLAYLRVKTGSLWSCIQFHLLMNLWATVEAVFYFHGATFLHLSKA